MSKRPAMWPLAVHFIHAGGLIAHTVRCSIGDGHGQAHTEMHVLIQQIWLLKYYIRFGVTNNKI
jgi:hypothetical protein